MNTATSSRSITSGSAEHNTANTVGVSTSSWSSWIPPISVVKRRGSRMIEV